MTHYNIEKSKIELREVLEAKDSKIEMLEIEIVKIKKENKVLSSNCTQEVEKALKIQSQKLNEKHKLILQSHSEKLKSKYKENSVKILRCTGDIAFILSCEEISSLFNLCSVIVFV